MSIGLAGLEPHFMMDPAISPDGEEVCFVYMDKLWVVDFEGGTARSLTLVDYSISNPEYSPDGKTIAYMTARDGYQCIYAIPREGGEAWAISKDDFSFCDWFADSRSMLVSRNQSMYRTEYFRLYLDGKLEKISSFAGSFSSLNRNGDKIIFCRRGYPYREKYTGSVNGELYIYDMKKEKYIRLTETEYTERYPQFSWQNDRIFFGASDGEIFQLYQVDDLDFSTKKQLTNFKNWSLRDLDVAVDNERIVFEHFDQLYSYDGEKTFNKVNQIKIKIKEDIIADPKIKDKYNNSFDNFAVSDDASLIVFSWKYDLFAIPVEGGEVKQITFDQKGIDNITIMPDNKTVIFSKIVEGSPQLFRFNIRNIEEVEELKWSRDKYIEYLYHDDERLMVIYSTPEKRLRNLAVGDSVGDNIERLSIKENVEYGRYNKNGRYLLYWVTDFKNWNRELRIYDNETEETHLIKDSPNWMHSGMWGKDNKSAFFTEGGDIYRLDLQPKHEYFYEEEDHWEEILKVEEKEEKKDRKMDEDKEAEEEKPEKDDGMEIVFEGLKDRIVPLVQRKGTNYVLYLTEEMVYYLNRNEEEFSIRKVKYSGEDDEEVSTLPKDTYDIVCRDKNWFYKNNSTLKKMPLDGGKTELIENSIKYEYDRFQLNKDVFDQVWLRFGRGFYDPDMHDLNWKKIRKKYAKYLDYAYEPGMLGNIVDEMIGELNASHTGFYPRLDNSRRGVKKAYLGALFDLSSYPDAGIRFDKVYRKSSLALNHDIKSGDILLSVDGEKTGKGLPLDELFRDKQGEKIRLEINVGDSIKVVEFKGLSYWDNFQLWYNDWVETRREMVNQLSEGRLAYLHIQGMDYRSYEKFEDELFGENFDKDGLIIDIRANGGGYTHDNILEILTKKQYGWSSSRYGDAVKYPTPINIWDKPIVLLIDEDSFSDAEIFPILFKHLKLGKVIGMPTSGSVIGTGYINFMDGSSMRMPSSGWYEMDKTNMEGKGAKPDILVPMTPEDYINDNDVQLKRAVEELLKEL